MNKQYWESKAFSVGYKPSKKNHDLFYRKDGDFVFFLAFGRDRFEKWSEGHFVFPLTYMCLKQKKTWEINRKLNEEKLILGRTNFNVFPGVREYGTVFKVYTFVDGYCKLCNKDLKKNAKLCNACREKQKQLLISDAKKYLAKHINEGDACFICGKKLFFPIDYWIQYFSSRNYDKYYFDNISEVSNILQGSKKGFKLVDEQKLLIVHHLSYYDEFTIQVCTSCHAKIHHSTDEAYQQYKPVDERTVKQTKYMLVNCANCEGQARVLRSEYKDCNKYYCTHCKSILSTYENGRIGPAEKMLRDKHEQRRKRMLSYYLENEHGNPSKSILSTYENGRIGPAEKMLRDKHEQRRKRMLSYYLENEHGNPK